MVNISAQPRRLDHLLQSRGQRTLTATTINRQRPRRRPILSLSLHHLLLDLLTKFDIFSKSNARPFYLPQLLLSSRALFISCSSSKRRHGAVTKKTQHCALDRFFVPGHLRDVRVSDAAASFTQCTRPQTPVPHAVGRPFEWLAGK